jgi:lipopolysaccharide export system permease protein
MVPGFDPVGSEAKVRPLYPGQCHSFMSRPIVNRLDRYVFRQLLIALIAATSALVALIWLTQSLRFVELVVNRGLSLWVFLQLTGLLIPNFVAVILPITTFVVVQFVYGRLSGDRELTVMRSAGMSPLAIARPGLAVASVAMVACLVLNVWIVPSSYASFREYQFEIRNRIAAFLLQEGVFTPVSDDLTVYVRSRDVDGTLRGILVEDGRQKNSRATILAERGHLVEGPNGPAVLLENGSREEIDKQTGRLNVLTFAQNSVELTSASKSDDVRYRDVNEMSLQELNHPETSALNARDAGKFYVEAQRRLSSPVTALSFALVALQSVLAGAFRRHGNVLRPLSAVLCVVALLAIQLGVANLAARAPVLMPLIWVVAAGPGLICAFLLFKPLGRALPEGLRLASHHA